MSKMNYCKIYDCFLLLLCIFLQLLVNCSLYFCVEIFLYSNVSFFSKVTKICILNYYIFLYWTQYWT